MFIALRLLRNLRGHGPLAGPIRPFLDKNYLLNTFISYLALRLLRNLPGHCPGGDYSLF